MCDAKRGIEKFVRVIILLLLPLSIISATPSGGEADKKPKEGLKTKSDLLLAIKYNLISLNAGVSPPDLEFVFPFPNQVVTGDNVLVWVTEVELPTGGSEKKKGVVFETSMDGENFDLLPQQEAPDFGPGSFTTALDTTAFPLGPLFLRARFKNRKTGPIIQVFVDRPSEADTVSGVEPTPTPTPSPTPTPTPTPFCGCQEIIVNATGDSSLEDPRRSSNGNVVKAPLGKDPDFLSFNFEVTASLKDGSDPELCNEGQLAKRTSKIDKLETDQKMACTKGRDLPTCKVDSDCDSHTCRRGFLDGMSCDGPTGPAACEEGRGMCKSNHNGECTEFPFTGQNRGNDNYRQPSPLDLGMKAHSPSPTWLDAPGLQTFKRTKIKVNYRYDADFLMFVRGEEGNCSCHIGLTIDWDGANQRFRAGTDITLVQDGETVNCSLKK